MKRLRGASFFILTISFHILAGCAITQPSPRQVEAFCSVKKVRIVVDQQYNKKKSERFPIVDRARNFLTYAGLKTVAADAEDYDATLWIQAEGKGLGAYYSRKDSPGWPAPQYYTTGASLSSIIYLEIRGISAYKRSFKGLKYPEQNIRVHGLNGAYLSDGDAAHETFRTSGFAVEMFNVLFDYDGRNTAS